MADEEPTVEVTVEEASETPTVEVEVEVEAGSATTPVELELVERVTRLEMASTSYVTRDDIAYLDNRISAVEGLAVTNAEVTEVVVEAVSELASEEATEPEHTESTEPETKPDDAPKSKRHRWWGKGPES